MAQRDPLGQEQWLTFRVALRPNAGVEGSFDGERVALYGIVRSEHEGGYGVQLPARDPAGRANPLNRFGRISAPLQRTSLSQRLKVLKLPEYRGPVP